jgi:hypothetical protein
MFSFTYANCFMFREKPSMALVLWEPPAGSVNPVLRRRSVQSEEDNNNTSAVDLNSISTPGYVFCYIFLITKLHARILIYTVVLRKKFSKEQKNVNFLSGIIT